MYDLIRPAIDSGGTGRFGGTMSYCRSEGCLSRFGIQTSVAALLDTMRVTEDFAPADFDDEEVALQYVLALESTVIVAGNFVRFQYLVFLAETLVRFSPFLLIVETRPYAVSADLKFASLLTSPAAVVRFSQLPIYVGIIVPVLVPVESESVHARNPFVPDLGGTAGKLADKSAWGTSLEEFA